MAERFRKDRRERPGNSGYQRITKLISVLMGVIYLGFGLFIILVPQDRFDIPGNFKVILGGILILYGILRFVRAYQQHFKSRK